MRTEPARVMAVVVSYRPDPAALTALLQGLREQVAAIWLVDNTPPGEGEAATCLAPAWRAEPKLRLLAQGRNLGVAAGFNIGIRSALAQGASHVLLSDQDSLAAPDMVAQLLAAGADLARQGIVAAALGPTFCNAINGQPFRFQVFSRDGRRGREVVAASGQAPFEVGSLISSGCLMPAAVLQQVGLMREELFIDYVDIEWCHRARAQGWPSYVCPAARLQHRLGERQLRVWAGRWRPLVEHSPLRLYFQARNAIWLMRQPYIATYYRRNQPRFLLGRIYAYGLFSRQRLASLKMLARGLCDGLRGRLGGPP